MLNRRERRKVFRQGTPLAAGRKDVEDRIHDHAKVNLARTPDPARLRQQRAQQYPLLRCRVACIAKPFAAIYFAGGFGPSHVVPLVESQTRRNHNRAGITRLIFGQALKDTNTKADVSHPGMMGDGTEEQNLNERGDPAARIKKNEVDAGSPRSLRFCSSVPSPIMPGWETSAYVLVSLRA